MKHLTFIINFLEQNGVINAYSSDMNHRLFELAKKFFKSVFDQRIVQERYQDMYFLSSNFDVIKFPLARLIHDEFDKLRNKYLKNLKEQAQQQEDKKRKAAETKGTKKQKDMHRRKEEQME